MRANAPLLLLAVVLAGCGGGDSDEATPTTTPVAVPATTTPATTSASDSDCPSLRGATTNPRHAGAGGEPAALLTDIDVEREGCVERVSFSFRDDVPAYRIQYRPAAEALVEDGSGARVEAEGSAFLVVRFEPAATAEANGDQLTQTFKPRRVPASGTRHVREVVKTGDFEAVLTWVIGLDEERPFRVLTAGVRLTVELGE
jgi:hypothetical protein